MEEMTVSTDLLLGLLLGVLLPAFVWGVRMFYMTKQLRNMHLDPDKHGFGTNGLYEALEEHFKVEDEFHREYIGSTNALRYAIKELSHFMRWMVKENTGKTPPPYVRGGD